MALILEYLFGGDSLPFFFFVASLLMLYGVERRRRSHPLGAWVPGRLLFVGIFLWTVGMLFDSFRRGFGLEGLRALELLFKFAGNVVLAYSAYGTYARVGGYSAGPKEGA